jgi:hypothetical protein
LTCSKNGFAATSHNRRIPTLLLELEKESAEKKGKKSEE